MSHLSSGSRRSAVTPRWLLLVRNFAFGMLLVAMALVGMAYWWLQQALPLAAEKVVLSIEYGTSVRDVARNWVNAGVQVSPLLLYEWFRWSGQAHKIRAGNYEIAHGVSPRELLNMMVRGDETLATVRLVEGWTFGQVRAEITKAEGLVLSAAEQTDAQIMTDLGAPGIAPEGRFFPDTYSYSHGTSDLALLRIAYRSMQRVLAAAWAQRASDTPLRTPDEALTLASIVEKETGLPAERGRVAAVFVNRLRIGMPLQTDPTVIYGLGDRFDGNLRKRDLQADTPYNTYTRSGLPPTPISMPSKASLLAAVQPEDTRALYFVARGDGSSEFSDDLAAHNRAVNRYQRGR